MPAPVLVLRAVGRCYICAESENSETACVLLLELYVRAGCPLRPEGEAELRAEARVGALSWRSRIVREKGRVADASPRDARGLILLMAGFGVPTEFPLQEFYELLLSSGYLACVEVLRCSQLFMKKLRDVVADMLNRGSYREAIGVILAFDLQEAFLLADILTYIVDKVVRNRKEQEIELECDLAGSGLTLLLRIYQFSWLLSKTVHLVLFCAAWSATTEYDYRPAPNI